MPFNQQPPSDAELRRYFVDLPPVPPASFELALVLGGTVSAGAFTAGALDFLFQALDDLSLAQEQGLVPLHRVTLKLIAGTSGGGVNAAIAARALAYDYPPITSPQAAGELESRNPFFNVWVNTLTLDRLLATNGEAGAVTALMNPEPIDNGAAQIVGYSAPPRLRDWLGAPLGVFVTMTNLRGVPYRTDFGDGNAQTFLDHADFARFDIHYPHQKAITDPRPDAFPIDFAGAAAGAAAWDRLGQYARATAAFPIGFPARQLTRPTAQYRYRPVMLPTALGDAATMGVRQPDWQAMIPAGASDVPEFVDYLCMDGGATDNQPIELARVALAGLGKSNPRAGDKANRAVLLVDPFAASANLGPAAPVGLAKAAGALIGTLVDQNRYSTSDLLLATNKNVFSRFMLTPRRVDGNGHTIRGGAALASAGLGAFIGFACRDFMRHDYLLGRENCRAFLETQFTLQRDNPVFANWSAAQKDQHQVAGTDELPIIPLFGQSAAPAATDPWPKGKLDPSRFRPAIEARYRSIVDRAVGGSLFKEFLGDLLADVTNRPIADLAIDKMKEALREAGLD